FATAGSYVVMINANNVSGTMNVWGDYNVANSTITLDYAAPLTTGSITAPITLQGTGSTYTVSTAPAANLATQMIRVRYDSLSTSWKVTGTSSGTLGSFSGAVSNQPFPASPPQFYLTMTPSGSPQDGDSFAFAVIAPETDANAPKRLMIGPSDP